VKFRLMEVWESLRSSYWFLPGLIALGAAALAFGMVAADGRIGHEVVERLGWIYTGGAEGARGVLSAIASSMITVAGVTFSVLVVALSQAASQFGPRVLGSFMRDTGNQFVLGTFVGTFLYCLLVLRTVRGGDDDGQFVPYLSVTLAIALAVLGVGVLIYFVHHAAASIQVTSLITALATDLDDAVERHFPDRPEGEGEPDRSARAPETGAMGVEAPRDGYVQAIGWERLVGLARKGSAVIRLERRPGDFVARGDTLARVFSPAGADGELIGDVCGAFVIGPRRLPAQDVEFSVNQLVGVAVRALSPGINDPFTATACVDRLGAVLARVAARPDPLRVRRDREGVVRLVEDPVEFERLADAAFSPVRRYAEGSFTAILCLLDALAGVARHARDERRRETVRAHAARVLAMAERSLEDPLDLVEVAERYRTVERNSVAGSAK